MKNKGLAEGLRNRKFYVISPHFDDAALSMGMFLCDLRNQSQAVVINCFTRAHAGPYTLSGRQFLKGAGYKNAVKLYDARAKEDEKARTMMGVKAVDLGLMDGLFRRNFQTNLAGKFIPELRHLYPTYRWHLSGKINPEDEAPATLEGILKKMIEPDAIVFAPKGIGNHADHVIVSKTASKLFKNLIYYVDFPYNLRLGDSGEKLEGFGRYEHQVDLRVKTELIANYKSQINGLFVNGVIPAHTEKFLFYK